MRELKETIIAQEITDKEVDILIPTTDEIINTLCSDEFGGRLVGSEGNKKAENYIAEIFKDLNLEPLFDESYYQTYSQEINENNGLVGDSKGKYIEVNNIVGVIKGCDHTNAVVISAHFDHIGYIKMV